MIVPINRTHGKWTQYVIVELQGDLEAASSDPESGQFLGDLHYNEAGIPIMILGMHVLQGKETILAKPMALFERNKNEGEEVEYLVKGIITKKVMFRGRPKPIVTDVPLTR
ncbi:chromosome transmission fidelity protein 8 homolog [Diachasma alloeum]|uniref:chromosome transmission fidelity protein 8 homolog n=1 Tax=Diachasma alloeum TaxID=454923 RepID=UPI00073828DB|nr:chromosome transmission fidelity protein 8 homolog [Diachasma alloeum]